MPRRPQTYTCLTCGKLFESSNVNPQYCSRPCRDQNPDRKQRYHDMFRQIPDRQCVVCGVTFRPLQRSAECCSFECSRLKIRKTQRQDITHCEICGKPLTKRQISNQSRFCSRACHGKNFERWHAQPENKAFMRNHGARVAMLNQRGPTSIERAMAAALDAAGIVYVYQFPISNRNGLIFVCDFAIPSARLIIECDGTYWHSLPNIIRRDRHKDAYLKAAGYTLLRFTEAEINQDVGACVHVILQYLR